MSLAVKFIAKNIFKKIFKNLAEELESPVDSVQVGLYFEEGVHKFEAYKNFKREKDIDLEDYCGTVVDLSGGLQVIEMTISQSGPRFAKEIGCEVDEVKVIFKNRDGDLPLAVLMRGDKKVRNVDINAEFLSN